MFIAVGDGAGFSMMDGTAMEHARRFDGSYSMVFMARMVAGRPSEGYLLKMRLMEVSNDSLCAQHKICRTDVVYRN